MKTLFDASVHFGQFCITSEDIRIACKNSQANLSTKSKDGVVGVVSFNENSWADHVIWNLDRVTQDTFYKFMDVFHSVKNIDRVPLARSDATFAAEFAGKFDLDISNALTCALAVSRDVREIHTLYRSLLEVPVVEFFHQNYGIKISAPPLGPEAKYSETDLEDYYQDALIAFKNSSIDLLQDLHK